MRYFRTSSWFETKRLINAKEKPTPSCLLAEVNKDFFAAQIY